MNIITEFLIKNKKAYLMVSGTLFPAFGAYMIAKYLGAGEAKRNVAAIAGLVIGGIATAKMLKV